MGTGPIDFERERDRAERLMTELLKATADTMAVGIWPGSRSSRVDGSQVTTLVGPARGVTGQPPAAAIGHVQSGG